MKTWCVFWENRAGTPKNTKAPHCCGALVNLMGRNSNRLMTELKALADILVA